LLKVAGRDGGVQFRTSLSGQPLMVEFPLWMFRAILFEIFLSQSMHILLRIILLWLKLLLPLLWL
jgi:hypothetical protein